MSISCVEQMFFWFMLRGFVHRLYPHMLLIIYERYPSLQAKMSRYIALSPLNFPLSPLNFPLFLFI